MSPNASLSSEEDLDLLAKRMRMKLVQMSHAAKTPHLGSALSCVDILVAAYWKALRIDPRQPDSVEYDKLILSKGHAASALYVALAFRGFFPESELEDFAKHGKALAEQPAPGCAPGVELATGSLGHGLPVGLGMALASKIQKINRNILVVMSDGECNEGSVWEAAMLAPVHRLDNLTVVVDYNKWQATGRSNEIMALESLREKWRAFGWHSQDIDGHDIDSLAAAMRRDEAQKDRPTAIIAHTIKGKGISFMEDNNNWHYRIPNEEEVGIAARDLGLK